MFKKTLVAALAIFFCFSATSAQKAEVTISLNEAFFDALLDSVFRNFNPPEFPIVESKSSGCNESIRILREMNGVRTAVRFREGKIFVPLAFSGNYAAPFVGCVEFAGSAEASLDLEFNENGQKLVGRARVLNINLNGTGGIGSGVMAKMVQSSIDKKLNPIEILTFDKITFVVPVQKSSILRMKAVGVRPEIAAGVVNIHIDYEFQKG